MLSKKMLMELAHDGALKRLVHHAKSIQELIAEFPDLQPELERIVPGVGHIALVSPSTTPLLDTLPATEPAATPKPKRTRKLQLTDEQRKALGDRMRKYWANRRAHKTTKKSKRGG